MKRVRSGPFADKSNSLVGLGEISQKEYIDFTGITDGGLKFIEGAIVDIKDSSTSVD